MIGEHVLHPIMLVDMGCILQHGENRSPLHMAIPETDTNPVVMPTVHVIADQECRDSHVGRIIDVSGK